MLSVYIEDPQELAALQPQFIPEDFSYAPEAVEEDEDLSDCDTEDNNTKRENAHYTLLPACTVEEARGDAEIASHEEPESKIERLYVAVQSPTTAFDFCFLTAQKEPRSRPNIKWVDYQADCYLAAKRALRDDAKLWFLFKRLYMEGHAEQIAPHKLGNSIDVQNIKIKVGRVLIFRGLQNMAAYFVERRGYNQKSRKAR